MQQLVKRAQSSELRAACNHFLSALHCLLTPHVGSLGFIGATHLNRRLITEDYYFEYATGLSRTAFLSRHGNHEFRQRNVQVLRKMLDENNSNCIIECGLISLAKEAQAILKEYSQTHPVIHIIRNFRRIRQSLGLTEDQQRRFEQVDLVHRSCSNFEYYNLHDPSCEDNGIEISHDRENASYSFGLKDAKKDFSGFLDFVSGHGLASPGIESPFSIAAVPPERRDHTFSHVVKLSDLLHSGTDMSELESGGGDVIELHVDQWVPNLMSVIGKQVALVRRNIEVPVILCVEDFTPSPRSDEGSAGNGSTLSCTAEVATILLEQGLRLGVGYISIDLTYGQRHLLRLLRAKGRSKVIGHLQDSHNDSIGWLDSKKMGQYQLARGMKFDIVRIVHTSTSTRDNEDVKAFRQLVDDIHEPHPPLIAYNTGLGGTPSLISNKVFTPVVHEALRRQNDALSFYPTAERALSTLFMTSIFDPLNFYISGAIVSYSLSPAMHGAAYRVCGMSHTYSINQTSSIEELLRLTRDPHFGGSAVNQPFRLEVMPYLTTMSYHAHAVGAVNTIIPLRELPDGPVTSQWLVAQAAQRKRAGATTGLYGDNTDWIGIIVSIRRNSSPRNAVQPSRTTGLVIGAGGMARSAIYALIRLGCRKIFIYNRTIAHAEDVAKHFNSWAQPLSSNGPIVNVLTSPNQSWFEGLAMPTIIVSCLPAHSVDNKPLPHFELPEQWLGSPTGGVVMEVSFLHFHCPNSFCPFTCGPLSSCPTRHC